MERNLLDDQKSLFNSIGRKIRTKPVTEAMRRVPRERFVSPGSRTMAYADVALAIGLGQTISQP